MEIIEREFAKKAGMKTYYTGKLCKKNHLSYRYVSSGACAECINGPSKFTDLRQTGLPPSLVAAEREARISIHAADMQHAQYLKAQHDAEVIKKQEEFAQLEKVKAEREAIMPTIAMDRYVICFNEDWLFVRSMVIFETKALFPCLTDEDIAPLNGTKSIDSWTSRHTIHTSQELWKPLFDMSNGTMAARRPKAETPNLGKMVRSDLTRFFALLNGDIHVTSLVHPEFRPRDPKHDLEEAFKLDGRWYRSYEIAAVMRRQRESIEPI